MRNSHEPMRAAIRIVLVAASILLLVVVANAYTVIMHGGRRVEIPSRFVVTPATLTYEVTEGIQITLPMAAIDIPATEKANHELPGSLLERAKRGTASSLPKDVERQKASSAGRRTITNRDLEASMRKRQESEAAYESRRKELGLPSLEESRKQAAAQFDLATEELGRRRMAERESEDYWRSRAAALRAEMAALDGELNYIRATLDEVPFPTLGVTGIGGVAAFGSFGGNGIAVGPFGNFAGGRSFGGQMTHRQNVYTAPGHGSQLRASGGIGGGRTRGLVLGNPGNFRGARPVGPGVSLGVLPNATVFGPSFQGYDFNYEQGALITRFNELAAARAGLNARWRELEDEARRAGVDPGWLRP